MIPFIRYADVTHNKSMQDILLQAQENAQSIIADCLNRHNFGQIYSSLCSRMEVIVSKRDAVGRIKSDVKKVIKK